MRRNHPHTLGNMLPAWPVGQRRAPPQPARSRPGVTAAAAPMDAGCTLALCLTRLLYGQWEADGPSLPHTPQMLGLPEPPGQSAFHFISRGKLQRKEGGWLQFSGCQGSWCKNNSILPDSERQGSPTRQDACGCGAVNPSSPLTISGGWEASQLRNLWPGSWGSRFLGPAGKDSPNFLQSALCEGAREDSGGPGELQASTPTEGNHYKHWQPGDHPPARGAPPSLGRGTGSGTVLSRISS